MHIACHISFLLAFNRVNLIDNSHKHMLLLMIICNFSSPAMNRFSFIYHNQYKKSAIVTNFEPCCTKNEHFKSDNLVQCRKKGRALSRLFNILHNRYASLGEISAYFYKSLKNRGYIRRMKRDDFTNFVHFSERSRQFRVLRFCRRGCAG